MSHQFASPCSAFHFLQPVEFFVRKVEPCPFDVLVVRSPANRCFLAECASMCTIDNPLEHAHVLAATGPEKLPVLIFAEPVYMEDARRGTQRALHFDPVPEVVAHVITAKRQHGHRIAPDFANRAGSSRCGL